jgi:hypothetical protein
MPEQETYAAIWAAKRMEHFIEGLYMADDIPNGKPQQGDLNRLKMAAAS